MKRFSMQPDPDMAWIYDTTHPRYNSPEARDLRNRRDAALCTVPLWMRVQAIENDKERTEP